MLALDDVADLTCAIGHAAWRIGLTGPPGVGKSSLAGRLGVLRTTRASVGVLAIDPSSPTTGGALLGDRIRMDELLGIERLFVRSLASRGASDGLARNMPELLAAMDAAGFDEVLLETVGVGQVEHSVREQVDTLVLVTVPGAGDAVQAMKAGVMELADVIVVNKADLPGAAQVVGDLRRVLEFRADRHAGWRPAVLATSTGDPSTVQALSDEIDRHRAWAASRGEAASRGLQRHRYRLRSLIERMARETLDAAGSGGTDGPLRERMRAALRTMLEALGRAEPDAPIGPATGAATAAPPTPCAPSAARRSSLD